MTMTVKVNSVPEPTLPGFEHQPRFWLSKRQRYATKVKLGEHYVTRNDELILTTLGSCIAACVRDPETGIGGMNHFILPSASSSRSVLSEEMRYGAFAMEQLINDILRFGGAREALEIKVTGGGQIMGPLSGIGRRNAEFIREFLATEGLLISSEDLGGESPRQVMYYPKQGRMLVKRMANTHMDRLVEAEAGYRRQLERQMNEMDVELF